MTAAARRIISAIAANLWLLLFAVVLVVVSLQLFVPPFVGLANNGDFGRVISRFSFAPVHGWGDNFIYFVADYRYDPKDYWNAGVPTSELLLVAPVAWIARHLNHGLLDIRFQGALHFSLLLLGAWLLLRPTARYTIPVQCLAGGLIAWILTDVRYVACLNSFYTDTAAFLGLLLAVSAVAHSRCGRVKPEVHLLLFVAGSLLLVCSKTQHAPLVLIACPLAFLFRCGKPGYSWAAASVLLCGAAFLWVTTPPNHHGPPVFSVVFYKLLPSAPNVAQAAAELGVLPEEHRWIGTHAYSPGNPCDDPRWLQGFTERVSATRLIRYHLRHPGQAFRIAWTDLVQEGPQMRSVNLTNYQRKDGVPAGTLAAEYCSWTNIRSHLIERFPAHIPVLYLLLVVAGISRFRAGDTSCASALAGLGLASAWTFTCSVLPDALETNRHLGLFHALTDIVLVVLLYYGTRTFPRPDSPARRSQDLSHTIVGNLLNAWERAVRHNRAKPRLSGQRFQHDRGAQRCGYD